LPTAGPPGEGQCDRSGERWTAIRDRGDHPRAFRLTPGLLTDAEIARALSAFRFSSEFRGQKRVPIRALAGLTGLSHMTLYEAMRPDLPTRPRRISETTRIKLSFAINAINGGRLRFRRHGQTWDAEGAAVWTFEPRHRRRITATY
jgi:hypothetical protein